ncbi:MAG: hypothetical protein AAFY34_12180, partial [Pseudomonadota bacterium]
VNIDANEFAPSHVLLRVRFVLSLVENDPQTAFALSELYANHEQTAQEVHRRLKRDILVDHRRGLLRITNLEAEMAVLIIASGVMEFLRVRHARKRGDIDYFLSFIRKICGYSSKGVSQ